MADDEFTGKLNQRLREKWDAMQETRDRQPKSGRPPGRFKPAVGGPAPGGGVVAFVCARDRRPAWPPPSAPPARPRTPEQQEADRIAAALPPTWGCPFCKRRYRSVDARNTHLKDCPNRPKHGG